MMDKNSQEFKAKLKTYRISPSEHDKITELLGRPPEGVEWALFSALWSEHCSYKSSKVHLKKLFSKSPRVLQSFGENAGVIDLGFNEKLAFKMESHNHPSFIEPYQGAATGVGGILRDIFTMGARPIALANFLCFGKPKAKRMEQIVEGVVAGISGYGNCVGVPTITGQTEFDESYNNNVLVNALAVGYFGKSDPVVTSVAKGEGNLIVYVGAKTGRDGVHGASMASESFDASSESKRPTIQIGDPFFEKLLIESCIEVIRQNLVVAIQDMGAAGLTSSCFEMAAKGDVGFDIRLNDVPLRDATMGPEEILLSESQERMLLVCEPKQFEAIKSVFSKWNLDASVIGEVKKERKVNLFWHGDLICSMDPHLLTENAPQYDRPFSEWKSPHKKESLSALSVSSVTEELKKCLMSVEGTSRRWVYRQYDQRVGAKTINDCDHSVSALRLPESGRAMSLVLGCRPYVMRLDAKIGGMDSVLYPALEMAAKGFEALAATDCLNYGNPEKEGVMSEFVASVRGMSEACEVLKCPIISGNVSFYNETENKNITSTPSTGLVGLKDTLDLPKDTFTSEDMDIFLLRSSQVQLLGLLGEQQGIKEFSGELNLKKTSEFVNAIRELATSSGSSVSTKVVGKYGLAYALYRMCSEDVGFVTDLKFSKSEWFKENLYEVLVAIPKGDKAIKSVESLGKDIEVLKVGSTKVGLIQFGEESLNLVDAHLCYETGWRTHFEKLS